MTTATPDSFAPDELADQAAPLDALLVDAALGPWRRFAPEPSTAKAVVALVSRPGTTARRLGSLAAEIAPIEFNLNRNVIKKLFRT